MSKQIEQAKTEYKCIFCGVTTYFSDESKAYCIDCYAKLRNSAHTHNLPQSAPLNPLPMVNVPYIYPPATPGLLDVTTIIC